MSKSVRYSRPTRRPDKNSSDIGELVHTNVVEPMAIKSFGDSKYYVTLYDDMSAFSMVRFLKMRSEVSHALKEMIIELETSTEKRVKGFRFDNAK